MGELGFGRRLLWIGFVGPDRCMIKAISQVPLGSAADAMLAASVMTGLQDVLADFPEGTTVAMLFTRPARGPISHSDRQWWTLLTGWRGNSGSRSSRSFAPTTKRWCW